MDIARWRCFLSIEISMSIDPDNTERLMNLGDSANRAKGNAMVPAQDEREFLCLQGISDLGSQLFRCLNDGFEIFQMGVADCKGFH